MYYDWLNPDLTLIRFVPLLPLYKTRKLDITPLSMLCALEFSVTFSTLQLRI
ncbi:17177_t:CDS:1, partial [Racocetra persica]